MKKGMIALAPLVLLQVIILLGGIWLSITQRKDCLFLPDKFAVWQCTGNGNPQTLPLAAFIVVPPLVVLFAFSRLGIKLSWKTILIIHVISAAIIWGALSLLDTSSAMIV